MDIVFGAASHNITLLFEYSVVLVLGLSLGSFATAIAYRVPRHISWAFQYKAKSTTGPSAYRSICPNCSAKLKAQDLIPLFSWIVLKGRCRHCKEQIPVIYPVIEGLVLLSCILAYMIFGVSAKTLFLIFLSPFLVALLIIDLQYLLLPNPLVAISGLLGALYLSYSALISATLSPGDFLYIHLTGALVFFLFAWALRGSMGVFLKKEALGFGDVKFFAVVGLWLGIFALPIFCLLSGVFGIIFGLLWKYVKGDPVFPFGPAIIVSFYALLLYNGSFF